MPDVAYSVKNRFGLFVFRFTLQDDVQLVHVGGGPLLPLRLIEMSRWVRGRVHLLQAA